MKKMEIFDTRKFKIAFYDNLKAYLIFIKISYSCCEKLKNH